MEIPENKLKSLKEEANEVLSKIDAKYSQSVKAMYFTLLIIIPLIALGILLSIFENLWIGLGCYMIALAILLSGIVYHINARYFWKKEREHAIWVFNVKLLQISLEHIMTLKSSESAEIEIDSTNRHR